MATSKFSRYFETQVLVEGAYVKQPLVGAVIYLVPQINVYPTGALQLVPHATRVGVYEREAVPHGEYKIYMDIGTGVQLYDELLWLGESKVSRVMGHFDEADEDKIKPTGVNNELINDVYNVTVKNPLQSGYYTHQTSKVAVPTTFRRNGVVITYQIDTSNWVTEKFISSNPDYFLLPKYWQKIEYTPFEKSISGELTVFSLLMNGSTLNGGVLTIPAGNTGYSSRIGYRIPAAIRKLSFRISSSAAINSSTIYLSTDNGANWSGLGAGSLSITKADGTYHQDFEYTISGTNDAIIMLQKNSQEVMSANTTIQFDKFCLIQSLKEFIEDANHENRIDAAELTITDHETRITSEENRMRIVEANQMALKTIAYGGAASNGASLTDSGLSIPSGSTGNSSYRILQKNGVDVSGYYPGQILRFEFDLIITNYLSLTGSITKKLQRYIGSTYQASLDADFSKTTEVINGTTKTIHCIFDRVITQSDIDNLYNYRYYFQISNTTALGATVTINYSNAKVLEQVQEVVVLANHETRLVTAESTLMEHSDALALEFESESEVHLDGYGGQNGAIELANGFRIPVGFTGSASYFFVRETPFNYKSGTFAGQIVTFTIPVTITNYAELSAITTLIKLQRYMNGSMQAAGVNPTSQSYIDINNGTTKLRTFTVKYIITEDDITNNYYYQSYFQLSGQANLVTQVVDVTTSNYLITRSSITQIEIDKVNTEIDLVSERVTVLESGAIVVTKTASRNGTAGVDADYVGRRAIQDAIDAISDATASKQYIIKATGIFEATEVAHFDKGDVGGAGQVHFIQGKDFVHLVGTGWDSCIIIGTLPNNLGVSFAYSRFNVIMWNVKARPEHFTVIGENVRYPFHIDGGQVGCKDYVQIIKSIKAWHKGNTGHATNWGSWHPIGIGMSDGQKLTVEDSELCGAKWAVYFHTNLNFSNPSELLYKRCRLIRESDSNVVIQVQPLGSGRKDLFVVENCQIEEGIITISDNPWIPTALSRQVADHAEIDIIITGKNPLPIYNTDLRGRGLMIKSKSTGALSSVRFDESSSGFLIIGNINDSTEYINRFGFNQIYGYQYRDGGNGLSGWACGLLDIGQYTVGISSNKYIGALGKRLGDCSSVNKTLSVAIDDVNYDIIFDKNYNGTNDTTLPNYTNTQIIAEITAVIGAVADVSEYYVGRDYYPQFDNVLRMKNNDVDEVLSGMGIIFNGHNTFRKALNSDNRIDGICLDEGRVGDDCRIIPKGMIFSGNTGQRFRVKEAISASRALGIEAGISTTQAGVFDVLAAPKLLRVDLITDVYRIL